jgi:hypothetical protein
VAIHSVQGVRPQPPVLLQTFFNPVQAHLAMAHLQSLGIPAALQDHHLLSMAGHLAGAVGGIKLWVPGHCAHQAADALRGAQAVVWPEPPLDSALSARAARAEPSPPHNALRVVPLALWTGALQLVLQCARLPLSTAFTVGTLLLLAAWSTHRGACQRHA